MTALCDDADGARGELDMALALTPTLPTSDNDTPLATFDATPETLPCICLLVCTIPFVIPPGEVPALPLCVPKCPFDMPVDEAVFFADASEEFFSSSFFERTVARPMVKSEGEADAFFSFFSFLFFSFPPLSSLLINGGVTTVST